ncbi:MAG: glycosyltransferase family 2 protein, partial [Actinomycetota bacterium]|nr:glycosyltransferase family 2 protein [Actinomycetota bacterium]
MPDLACVVISLRAQPGLVPAVRSLLAQGEPIELVVVNSGGGDPASALRDANLDVSLVELGEPKYAGAARNAGIAATTAPYVAFLAADCIAEPGWAAARLTAHRNGADAVATTMTCAAPATRAARASHLLLHHRRRPETPPQERLLYGLSYTRELLNEHGPFREDLRIGEDTELNRRIAPLARIETPDGVRTAHRYPATAMALLSDQFQRGRRRGRYPGR